MAEADELKDLIRGVRAGDPTAATELVVRFEPYVRGAVRAEVRERLSEDERRLSDLRVEGHTWSEIAAEVGGKPDSLRFRLTRALNRVAREVGLDDPDDG